MLNELLKEQRKLNSITKYPSILTYHKPGKKGTVVEEFTESYYTPTNDEILEGTEKVDGTGSRIVICGQDYLIGTREEFIYAKGDRIRNDQLNILKNCIPIAERLVSENHFDNNELLAIYGETYGENIGRNYKNYGTKESSFKVFDMWSLEVDKIKELLNIDLEKLATWREHCNQPYFTIDKLKQHCKELNLEKTPVLFSLTKNELPTSIEDMYKFLRQFKETRVGLDCTGKSEGFVIRSSDRKYIKKIRFEEYEKTLKIR